MKESKKFSRDDRRATLRKLRNELGLTQAEVATRAGVDQSALSRFERGERDLSLTQFDRVEEVITDAAAERRIAEREDAAARIKKNEQRASFATCIGATLSNLGELRNSRPVNFEYPNFGERMATMEKLIEGQRKLIEGQRQLIEASNELIGEKDTRIVELERQVADLRNLYEAETEAALAYDKARELREKLSKTVPDTGEDSE